jgi:DNA repair photolyase
MAIASMQRHLSLAFASSETRAAHTFCVNQDPDEPVALHRIDAPSRIKGRGAASNPEGRFESVTQTREDDGWHRDDEPASRPATTVTEERARSIISRNDSPDIAFEQSINPYRGCEHGCIYCYARPSHSYLNLSAGIDFETKLFAKANAAELLRRELGKRSYVCSPINLGANTDPYQPIERRYRITRSILEVLAEHCHPCTIVTKNALILRDLDLLVPMARANLVHAFVSVTSLDNRLASTLEPRASAPHRRLEAVAALNEAGVPCGVMVAPIIPMVTDRFLEAIVERAAAAGAKAAGYTIVRLPHELKGLFREWLDLHVPDRAEHVMSLVRQMRGGRDNDPRFGSRMRGEGEFAELIRQRFALACRRNGLARGRGISLDTAAFRRPVEASPQGALF